MEESGARLIALDAIKLVESGLGALCDVTVAVTAPEEVRVRRIMTQMCIRDSALPFRDFSTGKSRRKYLR